MAFVDPADQATPGPGVQQSGSPVAAGGAGIAGSSKASPSSPGQNVPAMPSSQLSSYLNANQPQAAALGQNVATNVGNQVQAAGAAIQPAVNIYSGEQYSVPTDAATNAAVASSPSSLTPTQQASYEAELGASAQAPNSANTFEASTPYATINTNIQNAVEQANLWNSGNNVADISTALQPYEGQNATTGDTTLDSLLLSQTPGAYGQIQSAVAPAANLQSQLAAGATSADQALQSAIQADQAATPAAQQAAQTYSTNLTSYLNDQVAADQNAPQAATATQLQGDLTAGNISAADATALGLSPAQMADLNYVANYADTPQEWYGGAAIQNPNGQGINWHPTPVFSTPSTPAQLNLAQYLSTVAPGAVDAQNVASPTQYADVAALAQLMGTSAPAEEINASTASQAGTAPTVGSTLNYQGAINDAYQSALAQMNAMSNAGYVDIGPGATDWNPPDPFAFAAGGEVKPKNLAQYLGA